MNISRPLVLEIEPTGLCNIRCKMCHVSFMEREKAASGMLDVKLLEQLDSIENLYVNIGATFEPLMHKHFLEFLKYFSGKKCELSITTNGTLLTDEIISEMSKCNFYSIFVSLDSPEKNTYETIRKGAVFETVKKNMIKLRKAFEGKKTFFVINMTIMKSNIEQLIGMLDLAELINFDQVSFIFMVLRSVEDQSLVEESLWGIKQYAFEKLDEAATYLIDNNFRVTAASPHFLKSKLGESYKKNILNNVAKSENSRARLYVNKKNAFQLGRSGALLKNDCISPFVYARVNYTGHVDLCYRYGVGNLAEKKLSEIWRGQKAQDVRSLLAAGKGQCDNCDYYRFCLKSNEIDVSDPHNFLQGNLLNFVSGSLKISDQEV